MTIDDKIRKDDRAWLKEQPQFQRLLFEILLEAGIYRVTREEQQRLFLEGRRSLGLEILGWFSADKAEPHDAIALAIAAGTKLKGAKHDNRDPESE